MEAHVIENGVVVNTIIVNDLNVFPNLIEATSGGLGWIWDGKTLSAPTKSKDDIGAQWALIRADRNTRLAACDWTQLPDAPVVAADWAAYRQELRDITTQADPFNIEWPVEPA